MALGAIPFRFSALSFSFFAFGEKIILKNGRSDLSTFKKLTNLAGFRESGMGSA